MPYFVGYSVDMWRTEGVPVSIGITRDEAMSAAITRVLSLGITDGEIAIQERDLSDADAETLRGILDKWFSEKGIQ